MKKIITIITFLFCGVAFAQFAQPPQYEFSSTSSYSQTQHTIPVSEIKQPFYNQQSNVVYLDSENPGYYPSDPGWENVLVDDPPIVMILLFAVLYVLYKSVKIRSGEL